jgi:hypothetical protein
MFMLKPKVRIGNPHGVWTYFILNKDGAFIPYARVSEKPLRCALQVAILAQVESFLA